MTDSETNDSKTDSVVYIGQKATTAYVMAAISQFQKSGVKTISLKARGRAISRCVDVAEVLTKRFMSGQVEKKEINISTEVLESRDGTPSNVSSIEIIVEKVSDDDEESEDTEGKEQAEELEANKNSEKTD